MGNSSSKKKKAAKAEAAKQQEKAPVTTTTTKTTTATAASPKIKAKQGRKILRQDSIAYNKKAIKTLSASKDTPGEARVGISTEALRQKVKSLESSLSTEKAPKTLRCKFYFLFFFPLYPFNYTHTRNENIKCCTLFNKSPKI